MSPFFDDLEAQLRSAARARAGAPAAGRDIPRSHRQRPRWLRAGVGAVPVVAAVLAPLVVVGVALVLLGHRGHGSSPPTPPPGTGISAIIAHTPQHRLRREFGYIAAATRGVESSKACRPQLPAGVSYVHGSPGSDLLSLLGVLRRPATPADHLTPGVAGALTGTPDIYRAYVRRAFSAGGVSYYVVPTRYGRAASFPSDRCFELQAAALDRYLPKIPASLRQPTRNFQAAMIAYYQSIAAHAPRDAICLVNVARNESGTQCGIAPRAIEEGLATQNPYQSNHGTYSGVVPDGVATVTLLFPAAKGQPTRSLSAPVRSNVYAVQMTTPSGPAPSPTVLWRSTEGRVLKRISPPDAAARARACKQNPLCPLLQGATQTGSASISSSGSSSSSPRRSR